MNAFIIILFLSLVSALIYYDLKWHILPDILVFSLLWLGLLANPFLGWTKLYDAVIGCIIGYLIMLLFYKLYQSCYHQEGLGRGDVKLTAALGAWFGWQSLPLILCIATVGTLLFLLILKLCQRYPQNPQIPLGPGLGLAGMMLLFSCLS